MKCIIAGSRTITSKEFVHSYLKLFHRKYEFTEIVSGHQTGVKIDGKWLATVDGLGEKWAKQNNIPLTLFPAQWDKYGKSAGPKRNAEMADYADMAIVFWDGVSRGSLNMIECMEKLGKSCIVVKSTLWENEDEVGKSENADS